MGAKKVLNEVESLHRREYLLLYLKLVFFNEFEIEDIIDETEEEVNLSSDDLDYGAARLR